MEKTTDNGKKKAEKQATTGKNRETYGNSTGYKKPPVHTRFSSTKQPKGPKGPKPSKLLGYIKENTLGYSDVSKIIKTVIFENGETELVKMVSDKETPMLIRLFVRAYLEDFKSGSLNNIEILLSRAVGKVRNDVTITADVDITESVVSISPKERRKRLDELIQKRLQENA